MDHFRHLIVGLDVLDLGHFDREDSDRLTTVEYHHAIEVSGLAIVQLAVPTTDCPNRQMAAAAAAHVHFCPSRQRLTPTPAL